MIGGSPPALGTVSMATESRPYVAIETSHIEIRASGDAQPIHSGAPKGGRS